MHGDNRIANLRKAMKRADTLVKQAKAERDRKGYRENLGYDSANKLRDYMATLDDLTFIDRADILSAFFLGCKGI